MSPRLIFTFSGPGLNCLRATLETWTGTVAEETEKEIDLRNIRSDLLEKRIAFLFPQKSFSEETEAQRT